MRRNDSVGKPFKKGQSGNPKGRPKKEDSWKEIFNEILSIKDVKGPDGKMLSRKRGIADRMSKEALKGRVEAANFISKWIESPAPTKISPVDDDGNHFEGAIFMMKKESLASWQKKVANISGSLNQDKPKLWRARHSSSSLGAQKEGENQTSSSEIGSNMHQNGEQPGAEYSSGDPTQNSKSSSRGRKKSTVKSQEPTTPEEIKKPGTSPRKKAQNTQDTQPSDSEASTQTST
jgi:hypothetical protein